MKYGGSSLLSIAIFGSSVLTFLTPFVVRKNVYAFLFVRIMEGSFLVSAGLVCFGLRKNILGTFFFQGVFRIVKRS